MSLFEESDSHRGPPDDTVRLRCTIKHAHTIDRHTEYTIVVLAGWRGQVAGTDREWSVSRRYRDFAALHAVLQPAAAALPLPPKRLLGNMQPAFVAERQVALQNYLTEVLKHSMLALSLPVRQFLDPKNYSLSFQEMALQSVSAALRGVSSYQLRAPLPDIGWRIRKRYFSVWNERKEECLLSWQQHGPDRCLSDKHLQSVFKYLQNMSHPHIAPVAMLVALEAGACAVRRAHAAGSARDVLYGADYTRPHLAKCSPAAVRRPYPAAQLARYGRQILETLLFMHEKGLPYGHLHPGNVLISNERVLLLDIENGVLGAPSLYRSYAVEHKGVNSLEALDVYCFGHTLYEMACAAPLEQTCCDDYPKEIAPDVVSVLSACLSTESRRRGLPAVRALLQMPLFAERAALANGTAAGGCAGEPRLKLPLHLKERLREAAAVVVRRLADDQKMWRSEKRSARLREILGSEEELRRRRRRARRRDSAWRSSSSLAEPPSASGASSPTPPRMQDVAMRHGSLTSTPPSSPPPPPQPPAAPHAASAAAPAPPAARGALLSDICTFNRDRLQRVNSQ